MSKKTINIVIVGPGGVGKTSIVNKLEKYLSKKDKRNVIKHKESEKHIYLEEYFKEEEKSKLALVLQFDFIIMRLRTLLSNGVNGKINIFDRYFIDDYGYMKYNYKEGFVNKEHLKTYEELLKQAKYKIKIAEIKIDYIFALKTSKDTLKKRIDKRKRFNETELEYLTEDIHNMYWKIVNKLIYSKRNVKMFSLLMLNHQ